jgi:hypothetical protein
LVSGQSLNAIGLGEELSQTCTSTLQAIDHALKAHELVEEMRIVDQDLQGVEEKKRKRELLASKGKSRRELILLGIIEETAEVRRLH